ncbi:15104_t:CDS:2 [Cetraspora pellucida]|uniref:15104_t:CDS:1 n=1 Tax=Cetraspora pellucida TaxID=1433469 RepID=A0A9N8VTY7_9GLOM|nr:15104_t:CDS:2 [Cetraspora pellucida]
MTTLNIGIVVEKNDPKELEWYLEKAKEDKSDGGLIQDDPKEHVDPNEETLNIGIKVKKDNSNSSEWYSKKTEEEDPAGLNNEQIRMDYQKHTDIKPMAEGTNKNKNVETDINIVPDSLDGKGISVKNAGVNNVEIYSFQHDEVNANFLVESSG